MCIRDRLLFHDSIMNILHSTFFGGGRLLWIMMMFQQKLLKFSSLSLIYGLYEQVAIWDAMGSLVYFLVICTLSTQVENTF